MDIYCDSGHDKVPVATEAFRHQCGEVRSKHSCPVCLLTVTLRGDLESQLFAPFVAAGLTTVSLGVLSRAMQRGLVRR